MRGMGRHMLMRGAAQERLTQVTDHLSSTPQGKQAILQQNPDDVSPGPEQHVGAAN